MAVERSALHGDEQPARLHLAAVVRNAGDPGIALIGSARVGQMSCQFRQQHISYYNGSRQCTVYSLQFGTADAGYLLTANCELFTVN